MRIHWFICRVAPALIVLAASWPATAEISITLNNTFLEKYKNRATIDAKFTVDHSKGKPNPASKDGDMHVAGRDAKNIGMAAVAEIMNAKNHPDAVEAANNAAGTNSPIPISGAWRIWNEHGGDNVFVQGKAVAAAQNSNPDHVFEIHPITEVGGIDIRASFQPIPGYDAKKPEDAFPRYESVRSKIIPKSGKVTIVSNGIGYNYVNFQMRLEREAVQDLRWRGREGSYPGPGRPPAAAQQAHGVRQGHAARSGCTRRQGRRLPAGAGDSAARPGAGGLARQEPQRRARSAELEPAVRDHRRRRVPGGVRGRLTACTWQLLLAAATR